MLFVFYPNCTTCKRAKKWLDEHGVSYTERDIKQDNPTKEELSEWLKLSGLGARKLFNTSGLLYKSMNLKDKLSGMTEDEMLSLPATDGMLVKRPILLSNDNVLFGFKEAEYEKMI